MIVSDRAFRRALTPLVAGLFAFVCAPRQTYCQDKPLLSTAMAEALFKEGKKLLAEGKIAEACRKLEGSYRIDPAPGTLLNLALCHEQEGKTATAWGELNESRELAKKAKRADREKIAKEHISAIESRLARFVVAVPVEVEVKDLVVEMDGVPLAKGAWGTAIPIDPGEHTAIAKAPKYKDWQTKFSVAEAKTATVLIGKLEKVPEPKPPEPSGKWKKPVGIGALALGGVLLGVGGYFGARAVTLGGEVATSCKDLLCDEAAFQKVEDGRKAALVSDVLLGVGVAAAGAGAFFLITAPGREEPASLGLGFDVTPGGAFLSLGGAF